MICTLLLQRPQLPLRLQQQQQLLLPLQRLRLRQPQPQQSQRLQLKRRQQRPRRLPLLQLVVQPTLRVKVPLLYKKDAISKL
jgi:hypothetical protein